MEGMISFGNKRTYEDFKKQIPAQVLPFFDKIREFCFSLGENVVEDVRMHRVVFCKSMTFRWFADVQPESDGVVIKIQKSRKIPIQIIKIKKNNQFLNLAILSKKLMKGFTSTKHQILRILQ